MKTILYNLKGEEVGKSDLPSEIFGFKREELNHDLMHQAVVAQIANNRQVIAHTKTRGEVRGGGRKPWRQKGTGRARAGSTRSPIWKGGGVTFGPRKNKNFAKKINKKMKRKALFMALSSKILDKELILVDALKLAEGKTKLMFQALENLKSPASAQRATAGAAKSKCQIKEKSISVLVVLAGKNEKVVRACMNMPRVQTIRANSLNIGDVLKYKYLIMPEKAVKVIKNTYLNKK